MGNREALLEGAKRCLYEKGYARTTARDIANAAGTSLAAIGYHYRSTDALLNAALFQAMQEWGDEMAKALATDDLAGATPLERFEAVWVRILDSFRANQALWAMQLEVVIQSRHQPEVREQLAAGLTGARAGLAALFDEGNDEADERTTAAVGSLYQALLTGVLMQWLIDPETAPTGHDLAVALRRAAATVAQ
ncbi:TetR family transcriptional regulator [Paractinoplanes abujensis]|uniref:AcrR family transcriptional regulator n=1 Tax=Paractinoplanes abujensis TaxID=882441 RepID=A0A7W7G1T8_9ACTN|nr:TetR/AcrR family transcriptional regulator [Actinoplanes abujensis]MBB4693052.1 AcrR family transcriptional regulator [Actinoplanes abujensis]GID24839.1 TetR family transcriptional regulator [Actinoplanes abujensis]